MLGNDDKSESEQEEAEPTNVSVVAPGTTTQALVEKARKAGNINVTKKSKPKSSEKTSTKTSKKRQKSSNIEQTPESEGEVEVTRYVKAKLLNSVMFPKKDRPDWMMEDNTIDSLPTATVANVISQHKMTLAMERQNVLKEDKATKNKGGLKKDQDIKTIKISEGEDNATTLLHKQRFQFRTPLLKPEAYWENYPVKWPEVNKRVHLAHLGLDSVISSKTLEMIHDRSDPTITIKMFSNINVMIGRDGVNKTNHVKQKSGYIEIESKDNWLEVASICQVEESLDNLIRVWTVMWPGEYGPANLRGVLSKHNSFASCFENQDTRKKVLEEFINRTLADNAVRAGQKLPPLSYREVDERAKDLVDRKTELMKTRIPKTQNFNQQNRNKNTKPNERSSSKFTASMRALRDNKQTKDFCMWFNSETGCQSARCSYKHVCGNIPKGKNAPCGENHSMNNCKK